MNLLKEPGVPARYFPMSTLCASRLSTESSPFLWMSPPAPSLGANAEFRFPGGSLARLLDLCHLPLCAVSPGTVNGPAVGSQPGNSHSAPVFPTELYGPGEGGHGPVLVSTFSPTGGRSLEHRTHSRLWGLKTIV